MPYGIASSSFHAIRSLFETSDSAEVAKALKQDIHVDDLLSGADSVEAAVHLQDAIIKILSERGFPLRKWSTSHLELTNRLPANLRETEDALEFHDEAYSVKTLAR